MNTRSRNQLWTPLKALALPIALVAAFRPFGSADAAHELREAANRLPAGKMLALGSLNRVDGLSIEEAEDGTTTLQLRGTSKATFNVYRLEGPDRLVIDISSAARGKVVPFISADTWAVGRVNIAPVSEGGGEVLRVTVDLKRESSYLVVPAGNDLNITVTPGEVPPEAYFSRKSATQRRSEIQRMRADAATTKHQADKRLSTALAAAEAAQERAREAEQRVEVALAELNTAKGEGRRRAREQRRIKERERELKNAKSAAQSAQKRANTAMARADKIRREAERDAEVLRMAARKDAASIRAQAKQYRDAAASLRQEASATKEAATKSEAQALRRMREAEAQAAEASALRADAKAAKMEAESSHEAARIARAEAKRLRDAAAKAKTSASKKEANATAAQAEAAALRAEAEALHAEAERMRSEGLAAKSAGERLQREAAALKDESLKEATRLRSEMESQKAAALAARAEAEGLRATAMAAKADAERLRATAKNAERRALADRREAASQREASVEYALKQRESAEVLLLAAQKAARSAENDRDEAKERNTEASRVLADAKARAKRASKAQKAEYQQLVKQAESAQRAAAQRVTVAEKKVRELDKNGASLRDALENQRSEKELLIADLERREREHKSLAAQVEQARLSLRDTESALGDKKVASRKQAKQLDKDLEARAARLRAVEARLKAVESTLEKKAGKLESLTASLDTAEKKLADSITGSVPTSNVSDDWNREIAKAPSSQVKDVRFEDGPEESRVIIEVDGPMVYAGSNLTPTMKLLALEGADIGEQLERSLDASGFGGPVRMVTSFKEHDTVKVIVAMQEDASPRLEEQPGRLVLHFPRSRPRGEQQASNRVVSVASPQVAGFATAPAALATQSSKRSRSKWRGERIDLEIQDAPIKDILLMFSDIGRINIISGDGVAGQVTMRLNSVPWDQALDIILRSLQLGMVQEGNIIRVATLSQLDAERTAAIEKANAQVRLKPLETRLIPLSYAAVGAMASKVGTVLSSRGSVTPDERTNTLIVMDVVENIAIAEQLVNKLDSQTPQVSIEARIVEARTNWLRELGIQWGFDFTASPGSGNPTGLWFPNSLGVAGGSGAVGGQQITSGFLLPSAQATPNYVVDLPAAAGTGAGGAVGFSFGSVDGNLNTNLRLSAAEDVGEVRIISAPKISTLDNTTAKIEQGVQIPISQVSAQGVNTRYVNATLGLSVTPHVTNEGSVMLQVDVQKNEADFVNTGARGDPTILTKSAQSQMLVQDGDTAVIGGIFTRNQSVNRKKVPWIADVPIIGWFFKNKREADTRTEVLIFLTPKIINRSTSIGG